MSPGLVVSNSMVRGPSLEGRVRLRGKLLVKPGDLFGEEVEAARGVEARIIESRCMGRGSLIVDPGGEVNLQDSEVSPPEVAAGAMLCFGEVSSKISHQHLQQE